MVTFPFADDLPSGALFYPCSGNDFKVPLTEFVHIVDEFWFSDTSYSPQPGARGIPSRFQIQTSRIWQPGGTVREDWSEWKQRKYPWIEPIVLTQRLYDRETGRVVTAHWRRGYGTAALAQLGVPISVFFYRGDSGGEGGSGTLWLMGGNRAARPLLREVLAKMPQGGLIVTDGSNCPEKGNPYASLKRFHATDTDLDEAVRGSPPFIDPDGRSFECVGSLGYRSGPTLIWRVTPAG